LAESILERHAPDVIVLLVAMRDGGAL